MRSRIQLRLFRRGLMWTAFLSLLVSCASAPATSDAPEEPDLPQFSGVETEHWLVQETEPVNRNDLLPAFAASASNYGCRIEHLGEQSIQNIYGERRSYYGISASCREGTIALITLVNGHALIGCAKPTTYQKCDQLLRDIAKAW